MAVLQDRHRWSEAEAFRWLQHEAIARRVKISVVADEVVGNPSSA
jgi:AmiR/NasT family two-component response regulator